MGPCVGVLVTPVWKPDRTTFDKWKMEKLLGQNPDVHFK